MNEPKTDTRIMFFEDTNTKPGKFSKKEVISKYMYYHHEKIDDVDHIHIPTKSFFKRWITIPVPSLEVVPKYNVYKITVKPSPDPKIVIKRFKIIKRE